MCTFTGVETLGLFIIDEIILYKFPQMKYKESGKLAESITNTNFPILPKRRLDGNFSALN